MEKYFSIRDLTVITGVKAHTIRIWESRYNLLQPERTGTNIRMYGNDQLRKLINVTSLLDSGIKISKIAELEPAEIERLTANIASGKPSQESALLHIHELILSMQEMDEQRFERVFETCVQQFGLNQTFVNIINPFLQKVGMMWCCDQILPANEHFISSLIKQKLFVASNQSFNPKPDAQKWVLALPDREYHEIGLLLAHYIIKSNQHRSIYLGPDVPYGNLKPSLALVGATHLLLFLVKGMNMEATDSYLKQIVEDLPDVKIVIATSLVGLNIARYPNIYFLDQVDQLAAYLTDEN